MFYNAYAKSIITYGSLVYGAADKTNQSRIESVKEKFYELTSYVFQKTTRFLARVLAVNKINTVYEFFLTKWYLKFLKKWDLILHWNCQFSKNCLSPTWQQDGTQKEFSLQLCLEL